MSLNFEVSAIETIKLVLIKMDGYINAHQVGSILYLDTKSCKRMILHRYTS